MKTYIIFAIVFTVIGVWSFKLIQNTYDNRRPEATVMLDDKLIESARIQLEDVRRQCLEIEARYKAEENRLDGGRTELWYSMSHEQRLEMMRNLGVVDGDAGLTVSSWGVPVDSKLHDYMKAYSDGLQESKQRTVK